MAAAKGSSCSTKSLLFPALRVTEHDSEGTAAALARLVEQYGAVNLTQLASDEEAQTGSTFPTRKKWFEDSVHGLRLDSGSPIGDFEEGPTAWRQSAESDIYAHSASRLAVLDRVITKIPDYLVQVARIESNLEIPSLFLGPDLRSPNLHCFAKLSQEIF
jgi:hypothetical protein